MIRVTLRGTPLDRIDFGPPKLMRAIGEGMLVRIRRRTVRGQDVHGRAFRPLSPGYALQKHAALGHSRADLQVSGHMLNSMLIRPRQGRVTLTFGGGGGTQASGKTFIQRSRSVSAMAKAVWHNETGAGRSRVKREFFDLSSADLDWVQQQIDEHVARETR